MRRQYSGKGTSHNTPDDVAIVVQWGVYLAYVSYEKRARKEGHASILALETNMELILDLSTRLDVAPSASFPIAEHQPLPSGWFNSPGLAEPAGSALAGPMQIV